MEIYKQRKEEEANMKRDAEEHMKLPKVETLQLLKKKEKTENIIKHTICAIWQRDQDRQSSPALNLVLPVMTAFPQVIHDQEEVGEEDAPEPPHPLLDSHAYRQYHQEVALEELKKEMQSRPTEKLVEDLRKKVKILQAVGYNSIEAEDWDVATSGEEMSKLETLLLDKNRKMEHEVTQLKVKLSEKTALLETAEAKVVEQGKKVDEQQKLIQKLEDDILKGYTSKEKRGSFFDDRDISDSGSTLPSEVCIWTSSVELDENLNPQLSDFGSAKYNKDLEKVSTGKWKSTRKPTGGFYKKNMVGTLIYMAPETLQEIHTEKSDVYCFAATVNELLTGVVPYTDLCIEAQAHTVLEMKYTEQKLTAAVASEGLRPVLTGPESAVASAAVASKLGDQVGRIRIVPWCWKDSGFT